MQTCCWALDLVVGVVGCEVSLLGSCTIFLIKGPSAPLILNEPRVGFECSCRGFGLVVGCEDSLLGSCTVFLIKGPSAPLILNEPRVGFECSCWGFGFVVGVLDLLLGAKCRYSRQSLD